MMMTFLCNWPEKWADSYHVRNGRTEANCNCKPAEEIYIFLTKKLYFGLLKAVDAFARYEIYFAQVNVAFIITPFASSSVPTSSIASIFSNGYQQSFSFDNSNNLFWLDQGLRSASKCLIYINLYFIKWSIHLRLSQLTLRMPIACDLESGHFDLSFFACCASMSTLNAARCLILWPLSHFLFSPHKSVTKHTTKEK